MKRWHFLAIAAGLALGLTAAAQPADTTGQAKTPAAKTAQQPAKPAVTPAQPVASDSMATYNPSNDYDEDYDYYYWEYNDNWSGYDPSDDYDTRHERDEREGQDNRDQGSRGE